MPEDLKNFKRTTLGETGHYDAALDCVVITRQKDYVAEGATVVASLEEALEAVKDAPVAFIMGGAQIYQEAMPRVEVAHITYLNADFEGDAFFTPLSDDEWALAEEESFPATDAHPFSYSFRTYIRKNQITKTKRAA